MEISQLLFLTLTSRKNGYKLQNRGRVNEVKIFLKSVRESIHSIKSHQN